MPFFRARFRTSCATFRVFNAQEKFFLVLPPFTAERANFQILWANCARGQLAVDLKQNRHHSRNAVKLNFTGILCPNYALLTEG